MKQPAANATIWMAAPADDKGKGKSRVTTVNQEISRLLTWIFGGGCLFFLLLALASAALGRGDGRSVVVLALFSAVNIACYLWAWRSSRPFRPVWIQTVLGGLLCPLAFLWVQGSLAPWWPAYALMGWSGAVAWVLHRRKPWWGLGVLLYYLANFAVVGLFVVKLGPVGMALPFAVLALTGLLLIELTELLSLSLGKVYERSVQHRRAKEELQELTRLKTEFFANVSHEFRTPITLTLGPLEAAIKGRYGDVGEELKSQLKVMTRNQQRLLALINQILDVSKAEAGAIELKAARIPDFNRFVLDRVESFRPAAEARGLVLRSFYDPLVGGMEIYVDRDQFDKILLNLLSNAMKFTKQGSIEVGTEIQGDHLVVSVADTGIGIREAELAHVFDRFRQADGSTTREFAGTGLGLALVQEFAKLHGGEVTVTSVYGEGTTFRVSIPLGMSHLSPKSIVDYVEDEEGAAPAARPESQTAAEAASDCAELNAEAELLADPTEATVVCAEDNPELRRFLRDMLRDNYNVYVGANGQEGLELVKKYRPDLILSDLMMPVMDGLQFCRKIREDPLLRPIPFVLLTARSMAASKLEGLEEGADDYLTKPFSEDELLARVRNLVSLRRQQLRLERELEAARAIQLSLLPVAPQRFEGSTLDYFYYPSAELSGDFCDILPGGGWVYFYLADVTSHGTASAQVTYLLKEIFSQLIGGPAGAGPLGELLHEAQRRYASYRLEYDVAFQLARLHPGKKALELVRGSSPLPLRVAAGGEVRSMKVKPSPAFSAAEAPPPESFHSAEFSLEAGDTLYFFTDGCYEFAGKEGTFGLRRLQETLGAAAEAAAWKESVFEALRNANGSPSFPDDVTCLRLKIS